MSDARNAATFAQDADRYARTLDQFLDYAGTWSALKRHATETGDDLVAEVRAASADVWGTGTRRVRFPLALRAGIAA